MTKILEYIMLNYTWFLGGMIIILLAIIGSYADKTNFGQGKEKESNKKTEDLIIPNKGLDDYARELSDKEHSISQENPEILNNQKEDLSKLEGNDTNLLETDNSSINETDNSSINETEKIESEENIHELEDAHENDFEKDFDKFTEEFNATLPKKDIMDGELLDDIDSLSLDKTKEFKFSDIPNLDDVELPEIKQLTPEEEDIWKF